jgi:hypothetical protein
MKRMRNGSFINLRYFCIIFVIAFGLIVFVACGGGGDDEVVPRIDDEGTQPSPQETLDRSNIDFVGNLLAKVEAGEWTLGEGLVATLKLVAGELDAASVLRHTNLLEYEGTGILEMAYEYLEDGSDVEAKAEISRLLDLLVFSNEQLEAMAGITAASSGQHSMLAASELANDSVENCLNFFKSYEIPPGVGDCLEYKSSPVLDESYPGTYRVFYPAESFPDAGWTDDQYNLALKAMEDTLPVFNEVFEERMGELGRQAPSVNIVFSVKNHKKGASAGAFPKVGEPCGIVVFKKMQSYEKGDFKQAIAHEVAHCYQKEMFEEQTNVKSDLVLWWKEGLAQYLSNVVYRFNNLEWGRAPGRRGYLDALAYQELAFTLFDLSYENFLFFQYLENLMGEKGFIDLVKFLPASGGRTEQENRLAEYMDMKNIFQDFAKAMTDETIKDTSGVKVPYIINERNCPTVTLTGPDVIKNANRFGRPFSVFRRRLVVEEDKQARLDFKPEGEIRDSARPADGIDWTRVPPGLPVKDCIPEIIMVVTTVERNSGFKLDIPEVEDGGCDIVGEWVVDNDSLDVKATAFELNYVSGEIRATFRKDGTVDVVYDDWEYQVFDWDYDKIIGDISHDSYEEFTYTTNAQGTTTYEVDGDSINFGHGFESDFLEGTETVHHIDDWTPDGYIADLDEVYDRSAYGYSVFNRSPNYELGGFLRLIFWNNEYILHRVGPADE